MTIMVRACIFECKEYVIIDPIDLNNQNLIKLFEMKHFKHPIVTIPLSEIEDYCKNVERKFRKDLLITI